MELRQIQSFITITQVMSFSKAAELLGYSQSALTVQIRQLEKELDVRLFDRMGKKISLTAQGRQFYEHAGRVLQEVNRARFSVKKEEELHNPLHIGTLESICLSKLSPIFHYFRRHYPKVPLKITVATPKELIEKMEYNELDLIYFLDRPRYNNRWRKVMEVREPIVFVSSPSFPWAGKQGIRVEELLGEPFFLTEKNENYRRELDEFLESRDIVLTPHLEISNTEFIINMIKKNRGVSYLPYFAVRESVEAGELSVLDVRNFQMVMYSQIFYHKDKWKTEEMERFIELAQMNLG